RLRHLLPAWSVSLLVHVVILSALAAATFSNQDAIRRAVSFDSALASYRQGEREELNIWADPATIPRDRATGEAPGGAGTPVVEMAGDDGDEGDGTGSVVAAAFGAAAPSATPRFGGAGKRGVGDGGGTGGLKIEGMGASPISTLPPAPDAD